MKINTEAQNNHVVWMMLSLLTLAGGLSAAASPNPDNLFDMSLEDLMEIPVIVSASRLQQKMTEATVPISIISDEDIHYSGLTNIPEILQFTPGVDIIPLDRGRYAVGVRGLHEFIADRTLTLINGRMADSPIFGGSEFYRYPILMEDIERIEIVRGPGGAAWGANAFTGVINIITKAPGANPGWLLSSTVNEYGDTYNHIRWSDRKDRWSWRMSVGYEEFEDSDAAGAGQMNLSVPAIAPLIGFDSYKAQDYARNLRLDTEFAYDYSDETKLSFGAGYSHLEMGDWELLGYHPGGRAWHETARSFAKIQHTYDDETSGYIQWSGNYNNSKQPSLFKWLTMENDIEAQLNKQLDNHALSIGGNVRFTHIDTDERTPESLVFEGSPFNETTAGIFLIDRIDVADNLKLEGQFRSDWYSETHHDWSTRITAIYALDETNDNNLRFSFAKAFRTPFLNLRNNQISRVYHPGLTDYLFNVDSTANLKNEETWSLEMGYSCKLDEGILFRTDAYYQRFEHLIGFESNPGLPVTFSADNIDGADSWGIETELSFQNKVGKLSLWHSYNDFQEDQSHQKVRTYLPAKHKAGITGRLFLQEAWCLNANYRYTDTTDVVGETTLFPIEANHRLDLTLSKEFTKQRGEFMIGVSDLLNKTQGPNHGSGAITAYETPGRTFFTRLQLRF